MINKNTSSVIKGMAIILIFLAHMGGKIGVRWFTPCGGIGVSMFLFMSGYGLRKSYGIHGLDGYWKNRIISVYPEYIIVTIFYIVFYNLYKVEEIVGALLLYNPVILYGWYFKYLIMMYVIFWAIYRTQDEKKTVVFMLLVSFLLFFIVPEIMAEQSFSFVAGVTYSSYEDKVSCLGQRVISIKSACTLIFFGGICLMIKQLDIIRMAPKYVFSAIQLFIKLPSCIGLIMIILLLERKVHLSILKALGAISYEFFLVHGFILEVISIKSIVSLLVILIFSLTIAFFLHYVNRLVNAKGKKIYRY